jgi:hypothetical protein
MGAPRTISALALILLLGLMTGSAQYQGDQTPLFLVGNGTGLTQVKPAELRSLFRGERSVWSTGREVIIVLPGSRVEWTEKFSQQVLGMSRQKMQRFWLGLVFQGRASAPVFVDSAEEVISYVRDHPGAIGMVPMGTKEIPDQLLIKVVR